jgi:putative ABC transport system ATP-binding protein
MLRITDVSKTFEPGTVNEKKALSHVSLTLETGDFASIVGSNGAGKSTLFNAVAGTFYPDEGTIELDGENITFVKEHVRSQYIGRLFQDPLMGTAPHMTIEENLSVAYLRASAGKKGIFSRTTKKEKEFFREQLLQLGMGLEDRMGHPVGLLSGGQRQALTLLMATVVAPRILLLDEHTAALDPQAAEKIMDLTKQITQENNTTCLMVTHNLKQAVSIGNRTLMMANGHIVVDITGEDRKDLTIQDLMRMFKEQAGKEFDNDRILLSE